MDVIYLRLLKLDTIKAFDCIGWIFLYELLRKVGFGSRFISMLEATNVLASSMILLQGWLTEAVLLKRLVCQGCPLSPLLYLIVANALSNIFSSGQCE